MGKPVTEKCSTQGGNDIIKYAASSMQGCPDAMEDFHTTILDLNRSNTSFFGVYDGHGGADVARYCSSQFHEELAKDDDYGKNLQNAMITVFSSIDTKLKQSDDWRTIAYPPGITNLLRRLRINGCAVKRWLWKEPYLGPLQEGCTACTVLIRDNRITVGNIGDSRCVLSLNAESPLNFKALDLSKPHEPAAEHEKERILKAGGQVWDEPDGSRLGIQCVEGTLPTSRSFGDYQFKQNKYLSRDEQMVISIPAIFEEVITNTMEFIVIGSPGIWSFKSSTDVIESVRNGLQSGKELKAICEELLDSCLAQGSKHNLSVIVVEFKLYQPPLVQDPPHVGIDIEEVSSSHPTSPSDGGDQTSDVRADTTVASDVSSKPVDVAQRSTATKTDDNKEQLWHEKKKGLLCFSVDGRRSGTHKAPRRHVKVLTSLLGLLKNGKCVSTDAALTGEVPVPKQKDGSELV